MATDSSGNQKVAFEWGNVPMQPNNNRIDSWSPRGWIPPALGPGDSHNVNGIAWDNYPNDPNTNGEWNEGELIWPSMGVCYSNPKAPGNDWKELIEYLRACGVDPNYLKEATFSGGEDKYDWQGGSYDWGIIFWSYIPKDEIIYIDWETGSVLTGKDFDGKLVGSGNSWGNYLNINGSIDNFWFTAFTNDPAKNNTAGWLE